MGFTALPLNVQSYHDDTSGFELELLHECKCKAVHVLSIIEVLISLPHQSKLV